MSYFVTVTFDLHEVPLSHYPTVYKALGARGLDRQIKGESGSLVTLPESTVAAEFNGDDAAEMADEIRDLVKRAFEECSVTGNTFISVGTQWAWRYVPSKDERR